MWNSPFYTTLADKAVNVVKGVGIGVIFLGSLYILLYKRGVELRGESLTESDHANGWRIVIPYFVWIIMWELLDLLDKNSHPSLHYGGMLLGILILNFVWYEIVH
jgi:hypothetical protein